MTGGTFTLRELFVMGGPVMWPLLVFSIVTTALAIERTIYIVYHNLKLDDLREAVRTYIKKNDLAGAKEYLAALTKRRVGARILLTLVTRSSLSEQRLEKMVEAEAISCMGKLESGFNFLTTLAALSPLTGFLGTVTGMISAFKSIAEATEVNAQIVASGIYEALITTVFGLVIAIVAISAHSFLTHVVDKFAEETEKTCSDLITELALLNESHNNDPGA